MAELAKLVLVTSPVAFYFLWLLGNYNEIYAEIYDEIFVIFWVITRKFRASMEPFYDLKISKYVE